MNSHELDTTTLEHKCPLIDRSDDQLLRSEALQNMQNAPENNSSSIAMHPEINLRYYLMIYSFNILLIIIMG